MCTSYNGAHLIKVRVGLWFTHAVVVLHVNELEVVGESRVRRLELRLELNMREVPQLLIAPVIQVTQTATHTRERQSPNKTHQNVYLRTEQLWNLERHLTKQLFKHQILFYTKCVYFFFFVFFWLLECLYTITACNILNELLFLYLHYSAFSFMPVYVLVILLGTFGIIIIIVMFLSAVWTIILTAPIHCRGCTATFIQIWWRNKLL